MYGKIFESMFDGTLATKGPWQAIVTFQQMIVLCDREGVVDMTPEAISRRTTIPLEIINIGIAALEQPDPESRNDAEDGRRIVRLNENRHWGWQIVNYDTYRRLRTADERRDYMREYQRQRRAKDVNTCKPVNPMLAMSTHADADADAERKLFPIEPSSQSELVSQSSLAEGASGEAPATTAKAKPKKPKRGPLDHFVPDGWAVAPELAEWARFTHPGVDLYLETKKFRSHEFAKPRSDWNRAWQNWIRRADEQRIR
jgi:hypothetical protein